MAAFYESTSCYIPFCWTFDNFKAAASETRWIGGTDLTASFIDTWGKIRDELTSTYPGKNWISFDGHGWVASFNEGLIERQRNMPGVDQELLKQLGVAIIDSWLGTQLNVFYKVVPEPEAHI